ncbi:hypothetical protein L1887_53568 [Cichorium endivia]|nr:hypothetical protein L1887_53568 [Cichorium endivia]
MLAPGMTGCCGWRSCAQPSVSAEWSQKSDSEATKEQTLHRQHGSEISCAKPCQSSRRRLPNARLTRPLPALRNENASGQRLLLVQRKKKRAQHVTVQATAGAAVPTSRAPSSTHS